MMIGGMVGVSTTGELSGMPTTFVVLMLKKSMGQQHLSSILHGGLLKASTSIS